MFHLLTLENDAIIDQLKVEEALLRNTKLNWCIVNHRPPKAIVMGISGKQEVLVNSIYYNQTPIPIVRRFTGGGTVVIDENTALITLIGNAIELKVPSFPQEVAQWNSQFYQPLLKQAGFALTEHDYVLGNKKFGGNAQYLQKERWVHHSTLLWDFSSDMMNYLLLPQKQPVYREKRDHEDFLCRLKPHFSSASALLEALINEIRKKNVVKPADPNVIKEALGQVHRQTSTIEIYPSELKNWNLGSAKTSGFDLSKPAQYYNIGPVSKVQSLELSLEPKSNSSADLGIC